MSNELLDWMQEDEGREQHTFYAERHTLDAKRIAELEKVAEAAVAIKYMVGLDITSPQSYVDRDNFFNALREAGYLKEEG